MPVLRDIKKIEAQWKKSCHLTHQLWCTCGNFLSHFKWPGSQEENGSVDVSEISLAAPEPSGGDTTKDTGGIRDVEEAIAAAISFELDDTGYVGG